MTHCVLLTQPFINVAIALMVLNVNKRELRNLLLCKHATFCRTITQTFFVLNHAIFNIATQPNYTIYFKRSNAYEMNSATAAPFDSHHATFCCAVNQSLKNGWVPKLFFYCVNLQVTCTAETHWVAQRTVLFLQTRCFTINVGILNSLEKSVRKTTNDRRRIQPICPLNQSDVTTLRMSVLTFIVHCCRAFFCCHYYSFDHIFRKMKKSFCHSEELREARASYILYSNVGTLVLFLMLVLVDRRSKNCNQRLSRHQILPITHLKIVCNSKHSTS